MICIIIGNPFGGEAGLLGGGASPLPPPVGRTLSLMFYKDIIDTCSICIARSFEC